MEIEIGRGKKARRAYGFDDVAIVPSRRTRDPDDVDISWKLGDYRFELPLLASAMDGVVSPETAKIVGKLGGLAVLNLEGIWTRFEDADAELERIAQLPKEAPRADAGDLRSRSTRAHHPAHREIKGAAWSPPLHSRPSAWRATTVALEAGSTSSSSRARWSRPSTSRRPTSRSTSRSSSARSTSRSSSAGCASYHTGLHLMRTGAAGVLVGVGPARRAPRAACWASASRRPPPSPTWPARARRACSRPAGTAGHRRRRHAHRRRRLQGHRVRRRRRDDRLAARARLRGSGARLPLGHGDLPPDAPARRARADGRRTGRCARSSPAPPTRTTAAST